MKQQEKIRYECRWCDVARTYRNFKIEPKTSKKVLDPDVAKVETPAENAGVANDDLKNKVTEGLKGLFKKDKTKKK